MKVILFDLDGTLTDTFELWYKSVSGLVKKHTGKTLTRKEYENKYWGADSRTKIRALITEEPERVEELYEELQAILHENLPLVKLFPGVLETVKELSRDNKLAVLSNTAMGFVRAQLSRMGILEYFSVIIADAKPKPDPDGLLRACRELGTELDDAVFVGDSRFDIKAGKNAGIRTVIIGRDIKEMSELEVFLKDF